MNKYPEHKRLSKIQDKSEAIGQFLEWLGSDTELGKRNTQYGNKRRTISMHILIGCKGYDHKDGNGLNNQRSNLRPATKSQNGANMKKKSGFSSKYKGVFWNKRNKRWNTSICVNTKRMGLGLFISEEDAVRAYNEAALKYFGEFARINDVTSLSFTRM